MKLDLYPDCRHPTNHVPLLAWLSCQYTRKACQCTTHVVFCHQASLLSRSRGPNSGIPLFFSDSCVCSSRLTNRCQRTTFHVFTCPQPQLIHGLVPLSRSPTTISVLQKGSLLPLCPWTPLWNSPSMTQGKLFPLFPPPPLMPTTLLLERPRWMDSCRS